MLNLYLTEILDPKMLIFRVDDKHGFNPKVILRDIITVITNLCTVFFYSLISCFIYFFDILIKQDETFMKNI